MFRHRPLLLLLCLPMLCSCSLTTGRKLVRVVAGAPAGHKARTWAAPITVAIYPSQGDADQRAREVFGHHARFRVLPEDLIASKVSGEYPFEHRPQDASRERACSLARQLERRSV